MLSRRTLNLVLGLGLVAPLAGLLPATARAAGVDVEAAMTPRVLGNADAKVALVEYFSMTCPHCARFHTDTLPKLKEKYIDTGKVKLELRDFPLDQWALRAAAMARCVEGNAYFAMVDVLMKQQARWSRAEDPLAALTTIGRLGGLSAERIQACMTDEKLIDAILNVRLEAVRKLEINSTPSFLLNGRKLVDVFTFEQFDKVIGDALG